MLDDAAPKDVSFLKAKQCMFYMYALLCYGRMPLERDDIHSLCELMVLVQQKRVFSDAASSGDLDNLLDSLSVRCQHLMTTHISDVVTEVCRNRNCLTQQ